MSVRFRKWICVAVFAAILLCGCSGQDTDLIPPTFESVPPADRSDSMRERVLKRCEEIHGLYAEMEKPAGEDSRSAVDAIETLLMEAGLDVVDTDAVYPDYLTTADRFRDFWVTRQESEVISGQANPDGTITLQVWMLSTDLKADCLFSHEVTVRPLDDGRFQFVGNRITSRTEYGLPYCDPRLTWEKP